MNFIPSHEQLIALGYQLTNTFQNGTTVWRRYSDGTSIEVKPTGRIRFSSFSYGGPEVTLNMPSEDFFNQFLIALEWQPA